MEAIKQRSSFHDCSRSLSHFLSLFCHTTLALNLTADSVFLFLLFIHSLFILFSLIAFSRFFCCCTFNFSSSFYFYFVFYFSLSLFLRNDSLLTFILYVYFSPLLFPVSLFAYCTYLLLSLSLPFLFFPFRSL